MPSLVQEDTQNNRLQTLESEVKKLNTMLDEHVLWLERVASHLKIPCPAHPTGDKGVIQNGEKTSMVNGSSSNGSPEVPLQIKDIKSQIVLQVYK